MTLIVFIALLALVIILFRQGIQQRQIGLLFFAIALLAWSIFSTALIPTLHLSKREGIVGSAVWAGTALFIIVLEKLRPAHRTLHWGYYILLAPPASAGIFHYLKHAGAMHGIPAARYNTLWLIYLFCILLAALILVIRHFWQHVTPPAQFPRLLLAAAAPLLVVTLYLGRTLPANDTTWLLASFVVSGLFLVWHFSSVENTLYKLDVDRHTLLQNSRIGWMVVSADGCIHDLNDRAQELLNRSRHHILQERIQTIIQNWEDDRIASHQPFKTYLRQDTPDAPLYASIQIEPFPYQHGQRGYIIWLEDIREEEIARRKNEKLRQEIFSLLYVISNRLQESDTLEAFAEALLYQLAYTYHCSEGAIYLNENLRPDAVNNHLTQVAQLGANNIWQDHLQHIPLDDELVKMLRNSKQILVADKTNSLTATSQQILQSLDFQQIVFIPLQNDHQIIGLIILARGADEKPFNVDEVIQMEYIGESIAQQISNRYIQEQNIIRFERQRLMGELHDSVIQNLYGLLKFIEAAQASFKLKKIAQIPALLERMMGITQQAIREMRLAIFELSSLDLQQVHLVQALQKRLAIVEGNVNMDITIQSAKNLDIPFVQEKTLYFIAQEILNNILRHAQARNIVVKIRQGRDAVIMCISDDGKGFNTPRAQGMGLKTMRDRAQAAGGKIWVYSKPNTGTRVIVALPHKPAQSGHRLS